MKQRSPARARAARACARLLFAGLLSIAAQGPARAESEADVEKARALFVEAARLGRQHRWKEARALYARSLQLKPAPITRYSLGVAQRETGRYADALASFRAFLAEPEVPATAAYMEPARAAITMLEGRIGRVTIVIEPRPIADLSLSIDGQPAPPWMDRPREVDPGPHEVTVRAPGFRPASAWFSVTSGGLAAVAIQLVPSAQAAVPVVPPATDSNAPPRAASPVPAPPARTLPIALMGAGGAVFVAGLTVGLVGVKRANDAPTRDGAEAKSARAMGIAGDVVAGVGIASAGVGLVLLLTQGRASSPKPPAVRASAVGSGAGIEVVF